MHACMPAYLHTYIPTYLHAYIPPYLHTSIPTYLHTSIPTYLHTYTYMPTCLHAYMPTCLHAYIPTYLHTYIPTYLHTYIHPSMHACMHTYISVTAITNITVNVPCVTWIFPHIHLIFGLTYDRYLQVRFLKWPLIFMSYILIVMCIYIYIRSNIPNDSEPLGWRLPSWFVPIYLLYIYIYYIYVCRCADDACSYIYSHEQSEITISICKTMPIFLFDVQVIGVPESQLLVLVYLRGYPH